METSRWGRCCSTPTVFLSGQITTAGRSGRTPPPTPTTLEPCAMCAGAAVQARLKRIVYGTADLKAGAAWSLYNIPQDRRLNHRIELVAGVLESECSALLTDFFSKLRPS